MIPVAELIAVVIKMTIEIAITGESSCSDDMCRKAHTCRFDHKSNAFEQSKIRQHGVLNATATFEQN